MEELTIREAADADIEQILTLYVEAGIEAENTFTVKEGGEHFKVFAEYPNYRIFVALLNDTIVGTYELLIMDNLAKHGCCSAIVEDVAVSPHYQGRGIGRALMNHAMQESRKARCYKLVLSSGLQRTRAHDFYDSVGFERHGISFHVALEKQ